MSDPQPQRQRSRILAIVPVYNEQNQIEKVVCGILAQGLVVLVVDDGSTDDTAVRAANAGAAVLQQHHNQGKGVALRRGFSWALEQEYEAIVTLDGDSQHDPAEIPKFLEAADREPYDLIIGARNFDDMPWTRYTMNMLGRWTFSRVMGRPMLDNQSGYRFLSRRLAAAALAGHENGYEFEVEMIVICLQQGYNLGWVPIRTIYNQEPSHINHVKHVINYLRLLWRVRRQVQKAAIF
jgi:glycosyltransferase involved in cell wall biosynthesis